MSNRFIGNSFHRDERLRGKMQFDKLVKGGVSFYQFPFKLIYSVETRPSSEEKVGDESNEKRNPVLTQLFPVQIGISVSKRKFKRAVDRNTIKRRIKESYRNLKGSEVYPILLDKRIFLKILILYTHKEILDSKTLFLKMRLILGKLLEQVEALMG